jgi:hypothetical protein
MRKLVFVFALFGFIAATTTPALAIKEFNDQWTKSYVESSDNAGLKELAASAKCNVCHVNGEKKSVRNAYGAELGKLAKAKELKPLAKSDPAKFEETLTAAFKKVEEMKAADGKTFGEKIKAGQLPGGDKDGK